MLSDHFGIVHRSAVETYLGMRGQWAAGYEYAPAPALDSDTASGNSTEPSTVRVWSNHTAGCVPGGPEHGLKNRLLGAGVPVHLDLAVSPPHLAEPPLHLAAISLLAFRCRCTSASSRG